MRVFAAEWRRLFARRALGLITLAMVLISLLVAVTLWYAYRPPSEAQQAQINTAYQQAVADFNQNQALYIGQCLENQVQQRLTNPDFDGNCTVDGLRPTKADLGWTYPDLQVIWGDILGGIAPTLAGFLAVVLGATLIGGEYSSRNIVTWLTFEPRRSRVYVTKLLACAIGAVVVFLVGLVVMLAAAWGTVKLDQGTFGLPANYWLGIFAPRAAWGLAVVAGAGVVAGALTFLFRRTWATLLLVAGYFGLVEALLARFVGLVRPYTIGNNALALVNGSRDVQASSCTGWFTAQYTCQTVTYTISQLWAGVGLGALLVVIALVGWLVFRRRDAPS